MKAYAPECDLKIKSRITKKTISGKKKKFGGR